MDADRPLKTLFRLRPRDLAYREVLGGRVVHERRFDVVRLWEMDPRLALRLGPGTAAQQ